MMILSILFFITAALYSAVGFGGGSTYNALLVIFNTNYLLLPTIALICNIIVVSGGSYRFIKAKHIRVSDILPLIITSIPFAWLGGIIPLSKTFFVGLLGITLFLSALRMLIPYKKSDHTIMNSPNRVWSIGPIIGAILGFLAGLTGIGGGIFLAPVLHLLNWGRAKSIAGICSLFILLNSISGLLGQIFKLHHHNTLEQATSYWSLFISVFIGGQIGSWLSSTRLKAKTITTLTAILILYVSLELLWRWIKLLFA